MSIEAKIKFILETAEKEAAAKAGERLAELALRIAREKFKRLAWSPDHLSGWAPISVLDAERIMEESIRAAYEEAAKQ